jgi:hypothetical protein
MLMLTLLAVPGQTMCGTAKRDSELALLLINAVAIAKKLQEHAEQLHTNIYMYIERERERDVSPTLEYLSLIAFWGVRIARTIFHTTCNGTSCGALCALL